MKRQILAALTAAVLLLGLLPTAVLAQGTHTTPGTSGHTADVDTRETYTNYLNDTDSGSGELTTEFSGRVWADRTVTTGD